MSSGPADSSHRASAGSRSRPAAPRRALADDLGLLGGELLEDREHQLLLAQGRGVLDLELFGEGDELGGGFGLEVLKLDFPHGETSWGMPARLWALGRGANAGRGTGDRASSVRASLAGYGTGPTRRDLSSRKAASLAAFGLVLRARKPAAAVL